MKSLDYQYNYSSSQTEEQIMAEKYGLLVKEVDESEAYETDVAKLFKQDGKLNVLFGSGCSCWDGDYHGWGELTKDELVKMATKWADQGYENAEQALGEWILANQKEI